MAGIRKRVTIKNGDARFVLAADRGRFDIVLPGKGGIRRRDRLRRVRP